MDSYKPGSGPMTGQPAQYRQIFHTTQTRHLQPLKIGSIKSSNSSNDGENASPTVPPVTPPSTVEIRFRRGSRRRLRQQQQQQQDGVTNGLPNKAEASPPKNWEDMTLTEKAIELYVGEKGILFWLNKLSYASIFVVIGAWILFRFVGPALNLYQLDAPPASPTAMFKG
ncbi:hypothetical protein F0562_003659 [Nyssa sinensis]|uniref:Uncharacterized protein n=1 Tax=Nyssa sinensis TaxID=561372 RepID=A0A5J5C0N0_9ASTE|nr:hypothetical protein F0562_003659 [Nyssa sinensis]